MVIRSLIFIHRWLGVALCVLFLLWFPSGIGMMYFPMPSVTPESRLERLPVLDSSKVVVPPADAAEKLGVEIDDLRLSSLILAVGFWPWYVRRTTGVSRRVRSQR